jgi:hypothetical protein
MKKSIAFFGTMALTLAIGFAIGQVGKADSPSSPGSGDDPIVTKSYVDAKIAALGGSVPTPAPAPTPAPTPPPANGGGSTTPISGVDTFKVVELTTGKVLNGGEGTEMIVRGGKAVAVIGTSAQGGLSDLTEGTNVGDGEEVLLNHMLLVPRNDGRAIKATSPYTTYVMVRGNYSIQ